MSFHFTLLSTMTFVADKAITYSRRSRQYRSSRPTTQLRKDHFFFEKMKTEKTPFYCFCECRRSHCLFRFFTSVLVLALLFFCFLSHQICMGVYDYAFRFSIL